MVSKTGIALTLIAGVLLIVAVACGDTPPEATPIPQEEPTEPTPQPAAPAPANDATPQPTAEPAQPTPEPDTDEAEPVVFQVSPCEMTLEDQLSIEFEYLGTVPTGFDGNNHATCNFSKPVTTVTVVLTGPATHTETFTLEEPSVRVSFPLPKGTLSITTREIVPPGEYQREITVTSVDGDTLSINDQSGVLSTVTIVEPVGI